MNNTVLITEIIVGLWLSLATLGSAWIILHVIGRTSDNPESHRTEKLVTAWFIRRYSLLVASLTIGGYILTVTNETFYNFCDGLLEAPTSTIGWCIIVLGIIVFIYLLAFRQPRVGKTIGTEGAEG